MLTLFAGIALLAVLGGLFFADRSDPKSCPSWPVLGAALLGSAVLYWTLKTYGGSGDDSFAIDFGAGCLGVLTTALIERFRTVPPAVSIGLATLTTSLIASSGPLGVKQALAGAAVSALIVGSDAAMTTAFVSAGLLCLAAFTQGSGGAAIQPSDLAAKLGAILAVCAVAHSSSKRFPSVPQTLVAVVLAAALGLGASFAVRGFAGVELSKYLLVPLIAGLAVHWLISEDGPARTASVNLIVGLIWLGAATLAYAVAKSPEMAFWLLLASGVPLVLSNRQAAGSAAPFSALVWYRFIQSEELGAGSDLSRFYILSGVAAGIGLVAAGWEWRGRVEGLPGAIGGALWSLLAGGLSLIASIVFGARGFVGALEGSGLGSMLGGTHRRPFTPALLSAVMATVGALCLPAIQRATPYGREEKMRLFISCAAAILLVAGVLYGLQIDRKKEAVK